MTWDNKRNNKMEHCKACGTCCVLTVRCILFNVHNVHCKSLHHVNSKYYVGACDFVCIFSTLSFFFSFAIFMYRNNVMTSKIMLANAYNWLNWQQREQHCLTTPHSSALFLRQQRILEMSEIEIMSLDRNIDCKHNIMNQKPFNMASLHTNIQQSSIMESSNR